MKNVLKYILFLAVIVGLVGCSATTTRRSFKETWKDNNITAKVKWNYMQDKEIDLSHMTVKTWRGTVMLTGRAKTDAEKLNAEKVALGVKGVTGVKNYLDVVGTDLQKAPEAAVAKSESVERSNYGKNFGNAGASMPSTGTMTEVDIYDEVATKAEQPKNAKLKGDKMDLDEEAGVYTVEKDVGEIVYESNKKPDVSVAEAKKKAAVKTATNKIATKKAPVAPVEPALVERPDAVEYEIGKTVKDGPMSSIASHGDSISGDINKKAEEELKALNELKGGE